MTLPGPWPSARPRYASAHPSTRDAPVVVALSRRAGRAAAVSARPCPAVPGPDQTTQLAPRAQAPSPDLGVSAALSPHVPRYRDRRRAVLTSGTAVVTPGGSRGHARLSRGCPKPARPPAPGGLSQRDIVLLRTRTQWKRWTRWRGPWSRRRRGWRRPRSHRRRGSGDGGRRPAADENGGGRGPAADEDAVAEAEAAVPPQIREVEAMVPPPMRTRWRRMWSRYRRGC